MKFVVHEGIIWCSNSQKNILIHNATWTYTILLIHDRILAWTNFDLSVECADVRACRRAGVRACERAGVDKHSL